MNTAHAAAMALLLVAGCTAAPATTPTPEPEPVATFAVTGSLMLHAGVQKGTDGHGCSGSGDYSDLAPGAVVRIKDSSGRDVGSGVLTPGVPVRLKGAPSDSCRFAFYISGISEGESRLTAQVAARPGVDFLRADAASLEMVVGDLPKPAPTFTAAELALMEADGWKATDSGAQSYIDRAHDLCDTMDQSEDVDIFTALRESEDGKRRTAGRIMLLLCDNSERFAPIIVASELPGARASGLYYVGDGPAEIAPGRYRTIGGVKDCYWKRAREDGDIIANDLVTSAPGGVRITVKASDHSVVMERCGIWIPEKS